MESAIRYFRSNLALQPNHPGLLGQLAVLEAQRGDAEAARAYLEQVAALGAALDTERLVARLGGPDPDAPWHAVLKRLQEKPSGAANVVAIVDDPDLLVEGVARAPDGRLFVGSVAQRRILVGREGEAFVGFADRQDGCFSIFGMVYDRTRQLLWAASGVVPQTPLEPDEQPSTALLAFDGASGALRGTFTLAEPGARLADLTLAPDGTIYVADTEGGRIYRLSGLDQQLELWAESEEFLSLQGLAWLEGRGLFAADYGRGLFQLGDDGVARAVAVPPDATLIGLDGLAATEGGALLAVQNGVRPHRVVQLPDRRRAPADADAQGPGSSARVV